MARGARGRPDIKRDVIISVSTDASRRALIDRAAAAVGKSRSAFVLEAACKEAEAVLRNGRFFALNDAQYRTLLTTLDKPACSAKLADFLATKAPWDE